MKKDGIRVILVEDDDEFREHLQALIGGSVGFDCVGAHGSAETALKSVSIETPEVVLLDLELPGKSGLDLIAELNLKHPEIEIVVLTIHDDTNRIFAALEAGSSGYLIKPVAPARILEALMDVHHGGAPMPSQIARLVVNTFHAPKPAQSSTEKLTRREEEVLRQIAQGARSKEVADTLKIAVPTVQTHLQHIYEKLHARSRSEAVAKFLSGL